MVQTNTAYMSDPARVERIVQRLMQMPLAEIEKSGCDAKAQHDRVGFVMFELVQRENLADDKIQKMSYAEFACLIDNVAKSSKYYWKDHSRLSEQLMYYKCLDGLLLEAARTSIPVRMFMALPLKAFYRHLINAADREGKDALRKELAYFKGYGEKCTIQEFLWNRNGVLNKSWMPFIPFKSYAKEIRIAHRDVGRVLVDSFRMAFPEQFNAERVLQKYTYKEDWELFVYDEEKDEWLPCE